MCPALEIQQADVKSAVTESCGSKPGKCAKFSGNGSEVSKFLLKVDRLEGNRNTEITIEVEGTACPKVRGQATPLLEKLKGFHFAWKEAFLDILGQSNSCHNARKQTITRSQVALKEVNNFV